jgi:hypothetical protein
MVKCRNLTRECHRFSLWKEMFQITIEYQNVFQDPDSLFFRYVFNNNKKGLKDKVHPRTGYEGPQGQ